MKKVPEDIQRLLKTVVDHCDEEDLSVRERQIRKWRRFKLLWEGFQRVWYSEVAHDWRIWDAEQNESSDQAHYDKPINIFKAYLESIIAALSITIPPIKCFPDDADNNLDLVTAKAGDKIAQLVYRHNDVSLLWLHSLFIYCTEGLVACYSYPRADEKYGTYEKKKTEDITEELESVTCPECGYSIEDRIIQPGDESLLVQNEGQNQEPVNKELINQEKDEFGPDSEDAELHNALINQNKELCPACMMLMDPEIKRDKFITTRLVGVTNLPKTRMCLEAYGGLYIKIPNYAKTQSDCPYLIYSHEVHYAMAMEKYEHLQGNEKLLKQISQRSPGSYNQYEQWGRLSPQYQGEYPINVVTEKSAWLRPAQFNILSDVDDIKRLKSRFPDGAKVTFVNDEFADANNEALDDSWTLTYNPLSDFLHHEPLGNSLISVQEITNDLISLVLQTIEHGIGLTFANPKVLSFKAFEQTEAVPGGVFPATPQSGQSLGDGFHELRTATLSGEVLPFSQNIQSLGQLVSGALPSLFGGQLEGSETASQYSMSRAQALQRLQNTWKIFTLWWKTIFGKVIPMYIKETKDQDDEHDVQRDDDGNFVNVFIRKAELEGKIGKIELEANENLPLTWSQKKDVVEKLMTNANPEILKIISAPENLSLIHEALGLNDFYVPGEDDKNKQYDEIKQLLNSEPIETGDPIMPEMPSVEIDEVFDNHAIEFEICRKWITSEAGRLTKTDNEAGYRNVLLHGKLHYQVIKQQMIQQQMAAQSAGAPPEKQKENLEVPISGEANVSTVQ